jgi:glucokinase
LSHRLLVGIDIGGTKMAATAITPNGRILGRAQAPTAAHPTYASFVEGLAQLVEQALAASGYGDGRLAGIGIGCTGPVDPARGTVHNPYTLPLPDGSDIVTPLCQRFGVPVALENDADAAALGECWLGAGAGRQLVVCITVGTGIGAGIVRHGRIVRGAAGVHPEIGHQIVDPAGPECYCGARGCWEALASGTAVGKAGQAAAAGGTSPALLALAGGRPEAVTGELVFEAARAGDEAAERILARAIEASATALFNLVHFLGPDAIILGGGVMRHYDLFEPALREVLGRCILMPVPGMLLAPARLGADAGVLGAARAVAQASGSTEDSS